jgi:hypothetical protein
MRSVEGRDGGTKVAATVRFGALGQSLGSVLVLVLVSLWHDARADRQICRLIPRSRNGFCVQSEGISRETPSYKKRMTWKRLVASWS